MPTEFASQLQREAEAVLDALRPGFLADGGNVEILAVSDDGTIQLELQGACVRCPARAGTLRERLEPSLGAIRGVTAVVAVPGDPTPATPLASWRRHS